MTHFKRAVTGQLGSYWIAKALVEASDAVKKARAEAEVEPDGAIRWKKSGNYLPDDFCEKLEYAKYPFSRTQTSIKRVRQNMAQIEAYRSGHRELDAETLYEARAAFGSGVQVVDVLTGKSFTT